MATAIINSQMDAINESFEKISSDLTTIRPLLKNASIGAYPTDTASGSIASFTDGADNIPVKELKVNIEPVQNLNGQSSPYPAGGSHNLFKATPYSGTYAGSVGADLKEGTGMPYSVMSDGRVQIDVTTAWRYRCFATDALAAGTYTVRSYADKSSVGLSVYQTDGNLVVKALKYNQSSAGWSAVQTFAVEEGDRIAICIGANAVATLITEFQVNAGSTIANIVPFENICPISGHDSVNVYRTGKNILVPSLYEDNKYQNGSNYGYAISNNNNFWITGYQTVKPSMKYTALLANSGTTVIAFYDKDKNAVGGVNATGSSSTFTTTATTKYINYAIRKTDKAFGEYLEVVEGDTLQNAPITAATYTIPLGQTVYGGTLNVTTGVLTVDRAMVDLGTLAWFYNSTNLFFIATIADMENKYNYASDVTDIIMSIAKYKGAGVGWANMANGDFGVNAKDIRLKLTDYTSTAALVAAITGQQLVYPLATPTIVQLTATQVSTLLGQNNIWADAGEISVVYRADTGLYIDKKLAQALNA